VPALRAFAQVFRCEYLPAEAPGLLIPFFLCARRPGDLLALPVLESLAAVLLVVLAGLGINAVADRHIDRKYATFKNKIPDAVDALGLRRTWVIIVAQLVVACGLGVHVSLQRGHWIAAFLVGAQSFFAVAYSLPPLHLKVRGPLWHALGLTLPCTVLPFLLTIYAFVDAFPPPLLLFIVGFSLVQYAWEFGNQAIDYLEDRAEGVLTPPVRMGLARSLRLALVLAALGLVAESAAFYWLMARDGLALSPLGWAGRPALWASTVLILLAGCLLPLSGLWRMHRLSLAAAPEVAVPAMRPLCRFARWQAVSIVGVACAAGVYFLARQAVSL